MLRLLSLLAPVTILASATPLAAQQSAPPIEVRAGSRVRLDAPGVVADRIIGTVIARTPDTLTIANERSSTIAVPVARITHLEVSRGDSRSAGAIHGIKWGAPIGLGVGVLLVALSDDCKTCNNQPSAGGAIAFATGMGAFWGAVGGAIAQHEQWAPFDLSPRTSFDPVARRGTLGLSARF